MHDKIIHEGKTYLQVLKLNETIYLVLNYSHQVYSIRELLNSRSVSLDMKS